MVLVGPSGCGKSTTLRMVAGLEEATAGTIRIGGRDVTALPPRKRDIAMVFQSYALYAHMSVRDNIGFGLKMAGVPKPQIADKVAEAAEILGMTDLLDRKPRQLSGGQRQRVAMGRAIVREPTAFLMDEPLSNLDAKLRVEMRGEITSLQRRIGTPTLYVTHDQTEAMTMGDRVAILRDGVLEQLGTPGRALRPAREHVRRIVHRLAGDEPDRGALRGRRRPRRACGSGTRVLNVPDAVAAAMRRPARVRRPRHLRRDPARGLRRRPRAPSSRRSIEVARHPRRVARVGAVRLLPDGRHRGQPGDRRR